MNVRIYTQAFNGGVMTPEFFGQIEGAKQHNGVATLHNFIPLPHGPARFRGGTVFVREVKDSTRRTRLIPFAFSPEQTMILELGHLYCRFHTEGGTLVSGPDTPYEVTTPYREEDLFGLCYTQSADILTITHQRHPPRELRRHAALDWRLVDIQFTPPVPAPTGVAASANGTGPITYRYVVTSVLEDGRESVPSAEAAAVNDLGLAGRFNTVTWAAAPPQGQPVTYNIYKEAGGVGVHGLIGRSTGTSFVDHNVSPHFGRGPPRYETPFAGANNFPQAVGYFDQRRVFAGTANSPGNVWFTQVGTESVIAASLPPQDSDRIAFRIASRNLITIRHIVAMHSLVMLSNDSEWQVTSVNSDAVTPTSISVRPQSYIGASLVTPALVGNSVLFAADRGGHVFEMGFNWQVSGYQAGNLCLRAAHLFDDFTIVDMAMQRTPVPLLWVVSSNGELRTLTYLPEEKVGAWASHSTIMGRFESVACALEGQEDAVYVVVRRELAGRTNRFIERFATHVLRAVIDHRRSVHLDSAVTHNGAPASSFGGLSHLEGVEVGVLADGDVLPPRVVVGGRVTFPTPVTHAVIGLPVVAEMRTLPAAVGFPDGSLGQGRVYSINRAWLRLHRSGVVWVGPDEATLKPLKRDAMHGVVPVLFGGVEDAVVPGYWNNWGALVIRHTDPVPLTVVSVTVELSIGG